jgi:hypothetical protein
MTPEIQDGCIPEYEREPDVRSIKFTQYLMPDGRQKPIWFYPSEDVPIEVFDMADALILNGAAFEAEMLPTGDISLTCRTDDPDDPLSHIVCTNGPQVVFGVQQLVRQAHTEMHVRSRD